MNDKPRQKYLSKEELSIAVREILILPPEKRYRAILDSPNPRRITRALPPQEFWITIKKTGETDSLELLELANEEQLIFVQDIECWVGDKIDPTKTLQWLELLKNAGAETVSRWLRAVDADVFITSLRHFMKVTKPSNEEELHQLADALPPYTLDGVYYIHFFSEKYRDVIAPILGLFAHLRLDIYLRTMEGMIWELGAETEEQALRWRNGRLRDLGIPDIEEAMFIYQYVDKATFSALPEKRPEYLKGSAENSVPLFPLVLPGKKYFVMEALSLFEPGEELDCILMEIAHLANRVVVADAMDMSNAEHLSLALSKVRAMLSIGLEHLVGGDLESAVDVLKKKWLLNIFQLGNSITLQLARRAVSIVRKGWLSRVPKGKSLLGHPLKEFLAGLNRRRPLFYTAEVTPYRHFDSIEEITIAGEILDKIEYLGELFFNRLELLSTDHRTWVWKTIYPVEISFETVLRTALANAAAGRGFKYKPIRKRDIRAFILNAFEEMEETKNPASLKRKFRKSVVEDLKSFLDSKGAVQNERERKIRDELIESSLKFLEDELGRLDPNDIEPKYIQGLVIRRE